MGAAGQSLRLAGREGGDCAVAARDRVSGAFALHFGARLYHARQSPSNAQDRDYSGLDMLGGAGHGGTHF
jgi:hypothetical protein